jgi:isopenicillin-N epimerase
VQAPVPQPSRLQASPPAFGVSVRAAIQFQADHDRPRARRGQECHARAHATGAGELLRYARQAIGELTGLEHICPDSPEWPKGQMATIPLPPHDAEELKRRLAERDEYRVEVPIIGWGGRPFVRVSVQGYTTREDLEALVGALNKLLPDVRVGH